MRYARTNSFSRLIPILLVIIIMVVAVAAVIAIGQSLLGGNNPENKPKSQADIAKESLLSTDANRAVRLTVRGPIVAQEKFRSYQIEITPDIRRMSTYEGYLEKQIDEKKLDNNSRAYEELVYALEKRKMMEGRQLSEEQNDLRGICANGKVYKFETLYHGNPVKTLWTSDCGVSKGSATANANDILLMFLNQIPDGKKIAAGVGLQQEDTFFQF
jgi:hypothetical protein cdivTM_02466